MSDAPAFFFTTPRARFRSDEHGHARARFDFAILRPRQVEVFRARLVIRIGRPVERLRPGLQHLHDKWRQFPAFRLDAACCGFEAQRIPQFERPERIGEAPSHRAIDLDHAIRNLRHHECRVAHVIAQQLPEEPADPIVERDYRLQPVSQRFDPMHGFERSEPRLRGGVVFERLAVERVDLAVFPDSLVETLPALFAQPSALDQPVDERRQLETVAERIVRNRLIKVLRHVLPDIDPHDVKQPVAGALRQADQRSRNCVDFLDCEVVFDGQLLDRGAEKCADAVTNKIRRVLAWDDALAQMAVAEIRDRSEDVRARILTRNQFDQMQITRRIEEVRAEEMLPKFGRVPFGNLCQWNAAGIGRNHCSRGAMSQHPVVKRPLDAQVLRDRFDNPVAVFDLCDVVIEVAGRNQLRRLRHKKCGRPPLQRRIHARPRGLIAELLLGQNDVEQQGGNLGVGKMRGNAGTHGSRSKDGGSADWLHFSGLL